MQTIKYSIIALFLSLSVNSHAVMKVNESSKKFGNIEVREILRVDERDYFYHHIVEVLYKDDLLFMEECIDCVPELIYVLHSLDKEDVDWEESGVPIIDDKVLSRFDLNKIDPFQGTDKHNSEFVIGLFTAGAGASGKSGSYTSYHVGVDTGKVVKSSYIYDYYPNTWGYPYPRIENIEESFGPNRKL